MNSRALERDRVDLDPRLAWQRRHLNGRACRIWRPEMLSIDSVHNLELAKIDHEDGRLDDVYEIQSGRRQHFAEILQHPTRLEFDPAFDDCARRRVQSNLPRAEYQSVLLDRLRIGTYRGRRLAERSRDLGISLIDRELEPLKLSVTQLRSNKRLDTVLQEFSQRDVDGLLAAVGYGIITPAQVLAKLLTPDELKIYRPEKPPTPLGPAQRERAAKEARKSASGAVVVSGVGDMLVRFARCCNPLPGEAITGFITRGRGVTVHVAGCPHALNTDPQRRVPVVWKDGEEAPRPIRLEVLCADQPGLLAAMTKAIASAGVNISTAEVKTHGADGRALAVFEVSVTSARQLNNLMNSIGAIDGVMRVSRLGQQIGGRY